MHTVQDHEAHIDQVSRSITSNMLVIIFLPSEGLREGIYQSLYQLVLKVNNSQSSDSTDYAREVFSSIHGNSKMIEGNLNIARTCY